MVFLVLMLGKVRLVVIGTTFTNKEYMTDKVIDIATKAKAEEVKGTQSDIRITFRDKTVLQYEDILGYQIGSGAVMVAFHDGKSLIFNFDQVLVIEHVTKEAE